jgi:hypothetical protein
MHGELDRCAVVRDNRAGGLVSSVSAFLVLLTRRAEATARPLRQGLTLVHLSARREHFLWDAVGTISYWMGHKT